MLLFMLKVIELAFCCYAVTDMARARSFYEGVLGLKPTTVTDSEHGKWTEYEFGPYALATLIGIIPGALVYSSVGAGLGVLIDSGKVPDLGIIFEWQILLPLFGLAALALVPVLYTRLRGRGTSP